MSNLLKIFLSMCLLGFFLIPGEALACSSHKTEIVKKDKSCCDHSSDHQSKQACKKNCCKDSEGDSGCSGTCDAKSCHNSSPTHWIQNLKYSHNTFFFENEKSYSFYKQPNYSSGVYSIWQPPKIG